MNSKTKRKLTKSKILKMGLILVLAVILLTVGVKMYPSFCVVSVSEEQESFPIQQRYTIVDNLEDPDDFSAFVKSTDNLNKIGDFYNLLNDSKVLSLLSVFDQYLVIDNFCGDKNFYYNSDEFIKQNTGVDIGIKSIQMNQSAFEYYHLKLQGDAKLDWDEISYMADQPIPILLGDSYYGIYDIGDIIEANYGGIKLQLVVKGILQEGSSIYYKSDSEFRLDEYIVLPYPPKAYEIIEKENNDLWKMLYFAMINCDIVTQTSERELLNEIKRISEESNFINFSVVASEI